MRYERCGGLAELQSAADGGGATRTNGSVHALSHAHAHALSHRQATEPSRAGQEFWIRRAHEHRGLGRKMGCSASTEVRSAPLGPSQQLAGQSSGRAPRTSSFPQDTGGAVRAPPPSARPSSAQRANQVVPLPLTEATTVSGEDAARLRQQVQGGDGVFGWVACSVAQGCGPEGSVALPAPTHGPAAISTQVLSG